MGASVTFVTLHEAADFSSPTLPDTDFATMPVHRQTQSATCRCLPSENASCAECVECACGVQTVKDQIARTIDKLRRSALRNVTNHASRVDVVEVGPDFATAVGSDTDQPSSVWRLVSQVHVPHH